MTVNRRRRLAALYDGMHIEPISTAVEALSTLVMAICAVIQTVRDLTLRRNPRRRLPMPTYRVKLKGCPKIEQVEAASIDGYPDPAKPPAIGALAIGTLVFRDVDGNVVAQFEADEVKGLSIAPPSPARRLKPTKSERDAEDAALVERLKSGRSRLKEKG